jgi:hypothetical protein
MANRTRDLSEERLLVLEGAATPIGDADASEVAATMLGLSVAQMKRTGMAPKEAQEFGWNVGARGGSWGRKPRASEDLVERLQVLVDVLDQR